jgi:branched-subunit amino acid transport protein AzlD
MILRRFDILLSLNVQRILFHYCTKEMPHLRHKWTTTAIITTFLSLVPTLNVIFKISLLSVTSIYTYELSEHGGNRV